MILNVDKIVGAQMRLNHDINPISHEINLPMLNSLQFILLLISGNILPHKLVNLACLIDPAIAINLNFDIFNFIAIYYYGPEVVRLVVLGHVFEGALGVFLLVEEGKAVA
jgi:hypothetical protein